MRKLGAAIRKEFLLLFSDKIGLFLLFILPLILVIVITSVQRSAFDLVNENRITLLVVNKDNGDLGDEFIALLRKSKVFSIDVDSALTLDNLKSTLLKRDKFAALYIPSSFSKSIDQRSTSIVSLMLDEFGLKNNEGKLEESDQIPLQFIYDPVMQKNFSSSILNVCYSYLSVLENKILIENLYGEMGMEGIPSELNAKLQESKYIIESYPASEDKLALAPNVTQHNVPAWTIFAMFFMVVSLGGNIVNERSSGAFVRLKTMPTSFAVVLGSKMIVFLLVALLQVLLLFSMGVFLFPYLGLPKLLLPSEIFPLFVISLLSAMAAVSYALLIGTIAKTQVQAHGLGAISVIIFAALGGIWVPSFIMPENLRELGQLSPLKWCLDGFYALFLQGGSWKDLKPTLLPLIIFIISSQMISFILLRFEKSI